MFDVAVVGGGMVGSAIALGLAKLGLNVAVIESTMPAPYEPLSEPDMRVSAISSGSITLLEKLGAWQSIQAMRTCPINRLSTWERPDCRTDFDAAELGAKHLCHIIENNLVQLGLHQAIDSQEYSGQIQWFIEDKIEQLTFAPSPKITLSNAGTIKANLIIGADGARSKVRQAANMGVQGWQYGQQALGIKIKTHSPQQDITWQQFAPTGPMAFLPLFDGYASLVWYHSASKIRELKQLPFDQLKQQIVAAFPSELVEFDILEVASFPLTRQQAIDYVKPGVLLMGDAAHTINPLAGQGVNLGFKDVACLLELVSKAIQEGKDCSAMTTLNQYQRQRQKDNLLMMTAMDAFYLGFSNDIAPLKVLRNLGLKIANSSGMLKKKAMAYAMGID